MLKSYYRRGEEIFLYVEFKDDKDREIQVTEAKVRIFNEDREVLSDGQLTPLYDGSNEYSLNWFIPEDTVYSLYQVEYSANYNEKVAVLSEYFYVIPTSEVYDNAIKIYGFVHQVNGEHALIGASVKVNSKNNSKTVATDYTDEEGKWQVFLYPGEYDFTFSKFGFKDETISVQFAADYREIQFDNVALESYEDTSKGEGIYRVFDNFITKEGIPLNGLNVKVFSMSNFSDPLCSDITNDAGEWELFLDPGNYFVTVDGTSLLEKFDQKFRLKVDENGQFNIQSLTSNVAIALDEETESKFIEGSVEVTDTVTDGQGNPIVDVQVNVYRKGYMSSIIAQDYTDIKGQWKVKIDPGNYVFQFYHPDFHEITEERPVR